MVEIAEKIKEKEMLKVLANNLKKYRLLLYEQYKKLDKKILII